MTRDPLAAGQYVRVYWPGSKRFHRRLGISEGLRPPVVVAGGLPTFTPSIGVRLTDEGPGREAQWYPFGPERLRPARAPRRGGIPHAS